MRGLRSCLAIVFIGWAAASGAFGQEHFCACMIGREPVARDLGFTVFSYTSAPGHSSLSGALLQAREEVERMLTGLGIEHRWDLVSSAVLMQCRLLQAVGAAALGTQADFSPSVRRGLIPVPLHAGGGPDRPEVFLFLNPDNPEGARLIEILSGKR
jgi:hypothetical protein